MRNEFEDSRPVRAKSGGAGIAIIGIMVAIVFIIGPIVAGTMFEKFGGLTQVILVGFGVFLLLISGIILIVTRLYQKTSSNEAFVRTGMGGQKTIIDGGSIVIPVVHNIVSVSLETMRLDVERRGTEALITGDNLRTDVAAEFYIKVQKDEKAIIAASTSLGEKSVSPGSVKELVFQKLVSALRTVAATRSLNELHTKRDAFAEDVRKIVVTDLEPNGLTLESVTISKLDQTPPDAMRGADNVFDAQGLRTIAEIVEKQKVEKNTIEREAEQKVKEQDVMTQKKIFDLDVEQSKAEAERDANIKKVKALQEQEAATYAAQQAELSSVAEVKKEQAIQIANVEKDKVTEVANKDKQKTVEIADIEKGKATEVALRDKEITIATKEKERALTEKERNLAQAEAEDAKQKVTTVGVIAAAERDKEKAVIGKQATVQQTKIEKEMEADVEAYTLVTAAEGKKKAAVLEAEATTTEAAAKRDAKIAEAKGNEAVQMVPVTVAQENVKVDAAKVEVLAKELATKAEHAEISKELEIALAKIGASKEVQIAAAKAMGEALAKANMTLWGSPEDLNKMSRSFYGGQSTAMLVDGFMKGASAEVGDLAAGTIGGIGKLAAGLIKKLTGVEVSPEKVEEAIKEEGLLKEEKK